MSGFGASHKGEQKRSPENLFLAIQQGFQGARRPLGGVRGVPEKLLSSLPPQEARMICSAFCSQTTSTCIIRASIQQLVYLTQKNSNSQALVMTNHVDNRMNPETVVFRQASIGGWKPDTREGCPYISFGHMKFDRVVGADLSRPPPIYRPSALGIPSKTGACYGIRNLHLRLPS